MQTGNVPPGAAAGDGHGHRNAMSARGWQEIGWNGISLLVPGSWHPAVILESYLLFEEDYRPVFEIRWQQGRGRFPARRLLRKLERSLGEARIDPWQPPADWLAALSGCQVHGFRWRQAEAGGRGLLFHNPATGRSVLLRFHLDQAANAACCARVVGSLYEQPPAGDRTWAVFDIRARLPARMRLAGQRFLPGSYAIDFRQDHLLVSLLRFKPAGELLRGRSLADFGDHLAQGATLVPGSAPDTATWQDGGSAARRLLRRLQRKKAYHQLILWHVPEKNVILGLRVKSNRPIPPSRVRTIREGYIAL